MKVSKPAKSKPAKAKPSKPGTAARPKPVAAPSPKR